MKLILTVDCLYPIDRQSEKDVEDVAHVHNTLADKMSRTLAAFLCHSEFDWDNDTFHMTIEMKEDDGTCPHCREVVDNEGSVQLLNKSEHSPEIPTEPPVPLQGQRPVEPDRDDTITVDDQSLPEIPLPDPSHRLTPELTLDQQNMRLSRLLEEAANQEAMRLLEEADTELNVSYANNTAGFDNVRYANNTADLDEDVSVPTVSRPPRNQ